MLNIFPISVNFVTHEKKGCMVIQCYFVEIDFSAS